MATPWPHIVCGVLCFFVFCFLEVFWFLTKSGKNLEKKDNSRRYGPMATPWPHIVCFFCFFVFSRLFWFVTKSCKNLEKQKKTLRLHTPTLCHYSPLGVCNFVFYLCFLGFYSRLFCYFWQKQKARDKQKTRLHTARGEQWQRVGSCLFFCLLGFLPEICERQQKWIIGKKLC